MLWFPRTNSAEPMGERTFTAVSVGLGIVVPLIVALWLFLLV